jgi:hypothetical protein
VPGRATLATILRSWAAYAAGAIAVLLAVAAAFELRGGLDELLWTTFAYPVAALGQAPQAPLSRLAVSVLWYVCAFLPWTVPLLIGALHALRRDEPTITRLMWVWLVCGLSIILVQRFSWWTYHMTLLFVPTAVLAVRGLDRALIACAEWPAARSRSLLIVAALAVPALAAPLMPLSLKAVALVGRTLGSTGSLERYREDDKDYALYRNVARFLDRPNARPGSIYVFGNPLIYLFSGRPQALTINGWTSQFFLRSQWVSLAPQIAERRPAYIFVNPAYFDLINEREPELKSVLERMYALADTTADGRWYELAPANR